MWQVDLWAGGGECAVAQADGGGAILAAASEDGVERLDALTGAVLASPRMEVSTVWDVAPGVLPDGRSFFAGAGHHHEVHRWDAVTGEPLGEPLVGHEACVLPVAAAAEGGNGGAVIVSGDEAGVVLLWDAATGTRIGERITGPCGSVRQIVPLGLSGGSSLLVCVDRDGLLWRWDAVTGEPVGEPVRLGDEDLLNRPGLLLAPPAADRSSASVWRRFSNWSAVRGERYRGAERWAEARPVGGDATRACS